MGRRLTERREIPLPLYSRAISTQFSPFFPAQRARVWLMLQSALDELFGVYTAESRDVQVQLEAKRVDEDGLCAGREDVRVLVCQLDDLVCDLHVWQKGKRTSVSSSWNSGQGYSTNRCCRPS